LNLLPVSLALFYRTLNEVLEVWTQRREDTGIYHGLLEFPGGKVESNESPLEAVVREVKEEVGIKVNAEEAQFMGIYTNAISNKVILLNVFLFKDISSLGGKGTWLRINSKELSSPYKGQIPGPNHQIIDDLYRSLYSQDQDLTHE
jgi:mutator protein MutT